MTSTRLSPGVTPPADVARMTTTTAQINPYPDIATRPVPSLTATGVMRNHGASSTAHATKSAPPCRAPGPANYPTGPFRGTTRATQPVQRRGEIAGSGATRGGRYGRRAWSSCTSTDSATGSTRRPD